MGNDDGDDGDDDDDENVFMRATFLLLKELELFPEIVPVNTYIWRISLVISDI